MWVELLSMVLLSTFIALASIQRRRSDALLASLFSLGFGMILGTPGMAILGAYFLLCLVVLWTPTPRRQRWVFPLAMATVLFLSFALTRPSLWGRLLGIAEGFWMAKESRFLGVGIGRWTWHQAAAQREILARFPMDVWRETASYFGVAPSLPVHLFAEIGLFGLVLWIGCFALFVLGVTRFQTPFLRFATLFGTLFFLFSTGTTPVQRILLFDQTRENGCDVRLEQYRESNVDFSSLVQKCPDIRLVEWEGSHYEKIGRIVEAQAAYERWHETFPSEVMPTFAMGRLAAQQGESDDALYWLELASQGNPKSDLHARWLKERAQTIVSGDKSRLRLWAAYNAGP